MSEIARPSKPHIFIFVLGGQVTKILTADGKRYVPHTIIDYDNASSGECPVCNNRNYDPESSCPDCGYDKTRDNALESAVWQLPPEDLQ